MSSAGGFWPGDQPAPEEEDAREPLIARGSGWSPPQTESEPEPVPAPPAGQEPREPEPPSVEVTAQEPAVEPEPPAMPEPEPPALPETTAEPEARVAEPEPEPEPMPAPAAAQHVPGELDLPYEAAVLEGSASGADRTVGVVVSRFNGEITNRLLGSALETLEETGVSRERITVMPVPGAFELPIGAMALAKTRRYSCIIALGCVIRGETAHFDYVAGEAASGLQLAGLETGVPIAFGVLTVDTVEQAEERTGKGADAARAALEMADLFSQLRAQAKP
jgi:6,7-dimethyl-8-ribityllumazine synthase